MKTSQLLRSLSGYGAAAWSPAGRQVISGNAANPQSLVIFDLATGRPIRTLKGHERRTVAVGFTADGKSIVSGSEDDTAKVWDAATGHLVRSIKLESFEQGEENWVYGNVSVSSDRKRLVSIKGQRGPIKAWDTMTGRLVWAVETSANLIRALAISPNGQNVMVGDDVGEIKLLDGRSGQPLQTFEQHLVGVSAVGASPDGQQVYSGGNDGMMRYWSASTGELLASTAIFENGEWVTITPEGFFDASEKGAALLNVVRGLEIYSIDQVYQALYRPDLVREKLAGDPQGRARDAAATLDLAKIIASGGAPRVEITTPRSGANIADEQVDVEAAVVDQGGGVGKIEWRVNGVTLGVGARGFERVTDGGKTLSARQTLALEPGDNLIEVVAYNAKGLIVSEPSRITVKWTGERAAAPPRLYVLAVGIKKTGDKKYRTEVVAEFVQFGPKRHDTTPARSSDDAAADDAPRHGNNETPVEINPDEIPF